MTPLIARTDGLLSSTVPPMSADRRKSSSDFVPMNALARLIHRRKSELDLSWHEIGRRGGFPTHSVVYQLATKKTHRQPPRGDTLKRLALALELPEELLRAAAYEAAQGTLGQPTASLEVAEHARVIIGALERMEERDRLKLRRIALAFVGESDDEVAQVARLDAELSDALDTVPGPTSLPDLPKIKTVRPKRK